MPTQLPIIKLCGNTNIGHVLRIQPLKPEWLGFIFYPKSKRYFKDKIESLQQITQKKIGVFVDMNIEQVLDIASRAKLDYIQLHGEESVQSCQQIRQHYPIIKAFGISSNFDFDLLSSYEAHVDFFLFDTLTPTKGGSGQKFNRQLIDKYPLSKPYLLSGGIDLEEALSLLRNPYKHMYAIDINSRFEDSPGVKNNSLIQQLLSVHYENKNI